MDTHELELLGLTPIEGIDIAGGDEPFWIPFALGSALLVVGAVVNNWADFKSSFAEGYAAGSGAF